MNNLIAVMRDWVQERGGRGLTRPWLVFKEDSNAIKHSAWVEVEDPDVLGQIILWETGECEVDLGSTRDNEVNLISSHQFMSAQELTEALEEAMDFANAVISRSRT
jgi:hypothetical protein